MSGHEASIRRDEKRGWLWAQGACWDCDWTTPARYNDRPGLQQLVDQHVAETSDCECYDVASMEWSPAGPCAHCRAVGAA